MHRTLEATVDDKGNIKLLEPIELHKSQRLLVTVMEDEDEEFIKGVSVTALLSEKSLGKDWLRPEEDEAWKHLQPEK